MKTSTDDDNCLVSNQSPALTGKLPDPPKTWNPAFNEFQFGDTPENINSKLPIPFPSLNWNIMPQATEFQHDVVKYFWLKLSQFNDAILKFIPPNTTVNEESYVCFLFFDQKLFNISIRLFYDNKHLNYNDIIEAYAKAVNTPVIKSENGREFFYDDNRIIYCAYIHPDKSHILIDVIQKGQVSLNNPAFANLNVNYQRRKSSITRLLPSESYKYDIMISYCHKDRELCHRLYYRLLEDKFRIWIDSDNIYGPIIEGMSEAIKNSQFVLICMSNAYKASTYCQLEAQTAFNSQACLIPLVIKKDFTQTDWLGMLCGLRPQIDFTKTNFNEAYEKLCTEIQRYRTEVTNLT